MVFKFLKRFIRLYIFSLIVFCCLSSCEKTVDVFVGFYNQPNFFDGKGYEPTLNVMGIIRPETNVSQTGSFIRVEKTGSSAYDTNRVSSFVIPDAEVLISTGSDIENPIPFLFIENELNFYGGQYYSNNFRPVAGETYNLTCIYPFYDTVFATTTLPNPPRVLNIKHIDNTGITLSILTDKTANMYQAVFITSDTVIYTDYTVNLSNHDTLGLRIEYKKEPIGSSLYVYAFDENLSNYFSVVTSSVLNLNSFRPPFSLVEGGYGVFGSLNFTYFENMELKN